MKVIKLNATDSTNTFLSELAKDTTLKSPTVIITDNQTAGRGQRNSTWYAEPGKSLAMSVYIEPKKLLIKDQFYLSMLVSLSVKKALQDFGVPKVTVKWPNDILSRSKKLAGILIENTVKQNKISSSIIGIGVNVNTDLVKTLPRLGSMYSQTHKEFDMEEVAMKILEVLIPKIESFSSVDYMKLKHNYEQHLFRKDQVTSFIDKDTSLFSGIIRGVTDMGQLKVETSSENSIKHYWPKEISLQY